MSDFDVAISLTQDELNKATQTIYDAVPDVFKGKQTIDQGGETITVTWTITQSPQFDLSASAAAAALDAVVEAMASDFEKSAQAMQSAMPEGGTAVTAQDVAATARAVVPAFRLTIPAVKFETDDGLSTTVDGIDASCRVRQDGQTISFEVVKLTAPSVKGPSKYFVDHVILPAMKKTLGELFSGLHIPPPEVPGAELSPLAVAIYGGHLTAAANLKHKGTPAAPSAPVWTGSPLSVLMSRDAIQATAGSQSSSKSDHDKGGSKWGGWHWSYDFRIGRPSIGIDGKDVSATFSLDGSIDAGVWVIHIPIGVGYSASATPTPHAVCTLEPRGTKIHVVTKSVTPFTLLVHPSGSVPSRVAGWMLEAITQTIVGSLSPFISQFLKGIDFTSIDVPTYTEDIGGTSFTMTPTNLSVTNVAGHIALGGSLDVTS
jgi:hypothetical protein